MIEGDMNTFERDAREGANSLDSTMDMEVARILDQYMKSLENGGSVSRQELLAQYPKYAARLEECLDGIELLNPRESFSFAPDTFEDFEIRGELGRGGMGVVYEAYQKSLDRTVALKVMRFGVVDPRALERFRREAETAGGLHHTNIVPVYATGREGDTSWYAMQLIDGQSLAQRIQQAYTNDVPTPVAIDEIVRIGLQAAEALDYAHQRDVVHRDVKPANLIVDHTGNVWLTDFGLARRLVDVGATMTGALMGTPRYMSPEQADVTRDNVDHHSDIYSLGATLYELSTGQPVFDGDDPLQVITRIREEEPESPRRFRTDLPRDLEVVLCKCLAKDPNRRYATAAALADDLRAIAEDRPIKARPMTIIERASRWTRKHRSLARTISIAVLATAATLIASFFVYTEVQRGARGHFRLRAGGGPYTAELRKIDEGGPATLSSALTVPMQKHTDVSRGDYEMQLAADGRWSETVRFSVDSGAPSELKFRTENTVLRSISIADAQAIVVADDDDPSTVAEVLSFRESELSHFGVNSDDDWTINVDKIECVNRVLPALAANNELMQDVASSVEIDFGFRRNLRLPWTQSTLYHRPRLATPTRALRSRIDLDNDGRSDSIIAAISDAALMAIGADGKILWSCHYPFPEPRQPFVVRNNFQPESLRFILDMHAIGDQNQDSVTDFAMQVIRVQPGVQNDVCFAVISGSTGELIHGARIGPIIITKTANWMQQGILRISGRRWRQSSIRFGRDGIQRSQWSESNSVFWGAGNVGSSFALPAALVIDKPATHAVQTIGATFQVFELNTGRAIGDGVEPGGLPIESPSFVRIDQSGTLGVLFGYKHRFALFSLDGTQLWEFTASDYQKLASTRRFEFTRNESDAHRPNWPLISDLDGDGVDEVIISPSDADHGIGVLALNSRSGRPIWLPQKYQFARIADRSINRMIVTNDVDGDGFRDIATASLGGRADTITNDRFLNGNVYIYVDWISGKTGLPLSWARHPVRFALSSIDTLEIDAVRSASRNGESLIEVEMVVGDSNLENELESSTIRFSPRQSYPTSVAQGITVCSQSTEIAYKPRWYHKRSGAYSLDDEKLILLGETDDVTKILGEQTPIASWKLADGTPCVAVWGEEPFRVAVHDLRANRTRWATQATELEQNAHPVVQAGTVNIAVQFRQFTPLGESRHVELRSGKNGDVIWKTDAHLGNRLLHAQSVPTKDGRQFTLLVCRGDRELAPNDGLAMSLISPTGNLVWQQETLRRANNVNSPQSLDDFRLCDINDDGFPEAFGPGTDDNGLLGICALDGKTGNLVWGRFWDQPGPRTNYVPKPWVLVDRDDNPIVAIIEPHKSDKKHASLVIVDAADGSMLIDHKMPWQATLPTSTVLADCSLPNGKTRFGMWLQDPKFKPVWTMVSIDDEGQAETINESTYVGPRGWSRVWIEDVDHDGIPEPFSYSGGTFKRNDRDSGSVVWSADFSGNSADWRFAFKSGAIVSWKNHHQTAIQSIDPASGTTVSEYDTSDFMQSTGYIQNLSPDAVTCRETASDGQKIGQQYLVIPTNDGIVVTMSSADQDAMHAVHSVPDPRWVVRPRIGVVKTYDGLAATLWHSAKSTILVVTLVLIPLAYLRKMFRDRRWSLRFFLVAPIIVLVAITTWRLGWIPSQPNSLFVTFLAGIGWLFSAFGIWYFMTRWRWARWAIPVIVVIIAAIWIFSYLRISGVDQPIRYEIGISEVASALLTTLLQTGGLCGWCVIIRRLFISLARRLRGGSATSLRPADASSG